MDIRITESNDAPLIHELMIQAFMEYKDERPPSSALKETIESIANALEGAERAMICYLHDEPVGMVRFQVHTDHLYFLRLSVIPDKQGLGIAKAILRALEEYAAEHDLQSIQCKVRMNVQKNRKLYNSLGYKLFNEYFVHKSNGTKICVGEMKKQLV